jgi:hypothetical protein
MKRLRLAAILFCLATVAHASDCTTSKEFVLSKPQTMAGILVDPVGEPVFGWGLELLSRKGVVQKLTTDKRGAYDFGEIPAGKYRIRMTSYGFCAPKVNCHDGHCAVEPKLRLKDKGVTVE